MTCHDYNKEWQAKHGYFKRETLQDMLRRENFMWAIAIKAEFGLEKLDAQIVEWMNVHRTSADPWVLPPKVPSPPPPVFCLVVFMLNLTVSGFLSSI